VLTAEEARSLGDATPEQRSELHTLIAERAVSEDWRKRFYLSVRAAEGLSRRVADDALLYLRSLAVGNTQPVYATPEQGEVLRGLARSRVLSRKVRRVWLGQLDAGRLTYMHADRTILEWLRAPRKPFVDPVDVHHDTRCPDGFFALVTPDATPRCYRVHTPAGSRRRVVEQIVGENPERRRKVTGEKARDVLTAVGSNPALAAALYGATRKKCSACNKPLRRKNQPGYAHGYGLDCWNAKQKQSPAVHDRTPPTTTAEGAR
jgi:hypothetical protein